MYCTGLIAAAGMGVRLGGGTPKGLRELAGRALVAHAVERMLQVAAVRALVVAAPPDHEADVRHALADIDTGGVSLDVIVGGAERADSVKLMMAAAPPPTTHVLIHDAARCCTPPSQIMRVVEALAAGHEAVIPVVPVVDTVARVRDDRVLGNVPRDELRLVQTPQGFDIAALRRAYAAAGEDRTATDDASLVARLGLPVMTVAGSRAALKVTTPEDLVVAQALGLADQGDAARGRIAQ
ncbi:MAG: 2-C-methyl-D-erythritol 4-phosphate cytidylyltransferase [Candidatus Nanopelagicales bacterium]